MLTGWGVKVPVDAVDWCAGADSLGEGTSHVACSGGLNPLPAPSGR